MRSFVIALIGFFVLTGCGADEPDVPALLAQFTAARATGLDGEQTAVLAAYALGDCGDRRAVPPLIDALRLDPRSGVRRAAAFALGALQAVDAAPVLIDSMLDQYGALWNADSSLTRITDHDFRLARPATRSSIVAYQAAVRTWFAKYEDRLRKHRRQPGPSQIHRYAAGPAQDGSVRRDEVPGVYSGERWSFTYALHLLSNGYFERRALQPSTGISEMLASGTWTLTPEGVVLDWRFGPHREVPPPDFRRSKLARRRGEHLATTASWAGGTLRLYPASRPPFDLALRKLTNSESDALPERLKLSKVGAVVGTWITGPEVPSITLTLNPDASFTERYDRGPKSDPTERAAGTRHGAWLFDRAGDIQLLVHGATGADGGSERSGTGPDAYEREDGRLVATFWGKLEALVPAETWEAASAK